VNKDYLLKYEMLTDNWNGIDSELIEIQMLDGATLEEAIEELYEQYLEQQPEVFETVRDGDFSNEEL
jgi:hypothetical protein